MASMPPRTVRDPMRCESSPCELVRSLLTFNQEQVPPSLEMRFDLEDTKRYQSSEGTGYLTCCVEDTQAPSKLIPLVESGEVEDDTGIESGFSHPEKPSGCHDSSKVCHRRADHGHGAKPHHCDGEHILGTELLSEQVHWRSCEDEWDVEDREQDVVVVAFEVEIPCHVVCFCVAQVGLVDGAGVGQLVVFGDMSVTYLNRYITASIGRI